MIEIGDGGSFLPAWAWWQWVTAVFIFFMVIVAGVIVYAAFFAPPGGIFFVPDGEEVEVYWREIMDERAARRGRISKRSMIYIGMAISLIAVSGLVVWLVW